MSEQILPDEIIPHGEEIVERFGGIRPMAAKLNVPVTTVQGWKKRDAIPAIRRDEILSAAALHNIDLKGLTIEAAANENTGPMAGIAEDPALSQPASAPRSTASAAPSRPAPSIDSIDLRAVKRTARATSLWTSLSVSVIVLGAGFVLFGMNAGPRHAAPLVLSAGAGDSSAAAALGQSVADLQKQVGELGATFSTANGTLAQRMDALEAQLKGNAPAPVAGMVDRLQEMTQTAQGRVEWQKAIEELRSLVIGLQGRTDTLEQALSQTQGHSSALGRTLSDISGRDLGAAAMLLALTQLRESVDRQTPFANDLALLRDVAQDNDPALAASVDKLAPYAASGVLSPAGLKHELLASASDIISAKARGENVSITDKIIARLQNLFTIRKDGMPVNGNGQEQALIAKAGAQLDANDVAGAVATLQQLQGPAAQAAQPWESHAAATLAAQQLDSQLVSALMTKIKTGLSGVRTINLAPQAAPATTGESTPATMEPAQPVLTQPEQPALQAPAVTPAAPEQAAPAPTPMPVEPQSTAPQEPGQQNAAPAIIQQ